ncbi:hypothetical protein RI129_008283 [Pyrocoelia pectoralis]|uniref:Dehydrogenase/reductase SDR family member 4 n=1 Tax=Pyrocoelia pectoralis TaxID=417401 RepID=A0AAN7VAU2_9COLE
MIGRGIRHLSNMARLNDKVAIVTASTDGIGFAIAKRLAQEGAKVVVSSRNQKNVDEALSKLAKDGLSDRVVGTVCHVGKAEDRKRIFDEAVKLGGLDILISNAAVNPTIGPILECSEQVWDKIFEINVKAAFLLAKDAVPLFQKRGGGKIIFISSVGGHRPFPLLGPYSVSKTALLGLTKAIAGDVATDNITVNCIAPGVIETKFSNAITTEGPIREESLSLIPMKRFGKPDEVASVAAFLASSDANYITGETILVTGGMHARL